MAGLLALTLLVGCISPTENVFAGQTGATEESSLNRTDSKDFIIENDVLTDYLGEDAEIEIPDGVKHIGDRAFSGCSSLKSVYIPKSVISIGYEAFYGCSSLKSINIPKNVIGIEEFAFSDCSSLTEIKVDKKNRYFSSESGILYDKKKETLLCCPGGKTGQITLPKSVTSIVRYAFSGCSAIKNVSIPEGVISIGMGAFFDCRSMTSVNIPESMASIEDSVFLNCSSLKSVNIPESVKSIEGYAFCGCDSLKNADIPKSVKSIGDGAFCACDSLKSVNISEGVTNIGERVFSYCGRLKNVSIPKSVTHIGRNVFEGCKNVTICCVKGSRAERYAKSKNIKYVYTLTVKPKRVTVTSAKSENPKTLTIKWKQDKKTKGYVIEYCTNKNFKNAKTHIISTNKTTFATITKLNGGKRYYVRMYAYTKVDGKTMKGAYSKTISVNVKR